MRAARIVDGKPVISEKVFTAQVIALARWYKWRVAHFRSAMTKRGNWVTAMSGDIGFPDLCMVRNGEVIFAELKSDKGSLTKDQHKWLDEFTKIAMSVSIYIWRPADITMIEEILK